VVSAIAGLEEAKNPSGEEVLRLIQIRLMRDPFTETRPDLSSQAEPNFYVGCRLTIGDRLHDFSRVGAGAVFGEKRGPTDRAGLSHRG
jgi:hypothetical protein